MELSFEGIVLRDYRLSDVEDEIRWMDPEAVWMQADTPWETAEPIDPEALRADMTALIAGMPENAIRWRLELETDGRHIGFLSSYYLDENFTQPDWEAVDQRKSAAENHLVRVLGIEICEADCWGRGIGTKALTAFMEYYHGFGENRFLLETWSGNARMLGCAQKLGFMEVKREKGIRSVDGMTYDALVLEKRM